MSVCFREFIKRFCLTWLKYRHCWPLQFDTKVCKFDLYSVLGLHERQLTRSFCYKIRSQSRYNLACCWSVLVHWILWLFSGTGLLFKEDSFTLVSSWGYKQGKKKKTKKQKQLKNMMNSNSYQPVSFKLSICLSPLLDSTVLYHF